MGRQQHKAAHQAADETEAMTLGQLADDGCPHGDEPAALFVPDAPEKQEPPEPFTWAPYGRWGYGAGSAPVEGGRATIHGELVLTLRSVTTRSVLRETGKVAEMLTQDVRERDLAELYQDPVYEALTEIRPQYRRAMADLQAAVEAEEAARKEAQLLASRRPAPPKLGELLVGLRDKVSALSAARERKQKVVDELAPIYHERVAAVQPRLLEILNDEYRTTYDARQQQLAEGYQQFLTAAEDQLTTLAMLCAGAVAFRRPDPASLAREVIDAPDEEDTAAAE